MRRKNRRRKRIKEIEKELVEEKRTAKKSRSK